MASRYSRDKLRRLRNDVDIVELIADVLDLPSKVSEGYFRFLCPQCSEFNTAANASTNLARCFRCEKNFNPIDMVIAVKGCTFRDAVEFLLPLL
jgi:DNA primase